MDPQYFNAMCAAAGVRMDASESVWFQRELEHISPVAYEYKFPQLKARQLLPTESGIPAWARVHTWRMYNRFGQAEWIANMADDLPRADATGEEASKIIKPFGASYGWDWFELQAMQATGRQLDQMRVRAARYAVDLKMDTVLATGDTLTNLEGLLNVTGAQTYTLATKDAGGTSWGTAAAPNATADEVANDLMGMASARVTASLEVFDRFVIVLPTAEYQYASTVRMGDNLTSALDYAKNTSPHIEDIVSWYKCTGAGSGGSDRIVCYARDPMVIAAIVPMEFRQLPMQGRNLRFEVPCLASTGGVVCRHTQAIAYADINV